MKYSQHFMTYNIVYSQYLLILEINIFNIKYFTEYLTSKLKENVLQILIS
jgi:hypothetical protein